MIEHLLRLSRIYVEANGVHLTTLSSRMFGDGKKLGRLEAGKDISVTRYAKAMRWLSSNWPADVEWPHDIERPRQEASA